MTNKILFKKNLLPLILLIIAAGFVFTYNLSSGSLNSWDEAFYAGVSQEIIKTGDWINLRWAGSSWSDKPPLAMWGTAMMYKIHGINEFSARFFSACSGIGTIILIYLLAVRLYSKEAGIAAALILLSTWHLIWSGRQGALDVPITFFTTLTLYLFVLSEERKAALFFVPIAFALAFFTKSFAAVIIPIILIFYMVSAKRVKDCMNPGLLWGIFIALVFLLWWHVSAYMAYGQDFIKGYFLQHLVLRSQQALDGHTGDFFSYFSVISNKGRPWGTVGLIIFPCALFYYFTKKEKKLLLPLIWTATVILLYSVAKTKLHWYIMPVYPALALISGWGISRILKDKTVKVIVPIALITLVYLISSKEIFNMDYSPQTKSMAGRIKGLAKEKDKIYMYGIGDPGLQFYLGMDAENVSKEEAMIKIAEGKNTLILIPDDQSEILHNENVKPILCENNLTLFKANTKN